MHFEKAMEGYRHLQELIEPVYPGLLNLIEDTIKNAERDFDLDGKKDQDSFLWEHSIFVATIALKICRIENQAPLIPVLSALFHDAGKFDEGQYHKGDVPEEQISAHIAEKLLTSSGLDKREIERITSALNALYKEQAERDIVSDIIHDADFLSKTGHLGVAAFFMKSAKRGQSLLTSLCKNLSKELTYAAVLSKNMRTVAGKKLAEKRSRKIQFYFQGILEELRELDIARFEIREETLPCPQIQGEDLNFVLVIPESCPSCSKSLSPQYSFVQGIKCTELEVSLSCLSCPTTIRISFCLPEMIC